MRDCARSADACASGYRARRSSHIGARPCTCVRVRVHRGLTHLLRASAGTPPLRLRAQLELNCRSFARFLSRTDECGINPLLSPFQYGNGPRHLRGQRVKMRTCTLSGREEREIGEKRDDDCLALSSGRVSATALKCSRGGRADKGASDDRPFPFCCTVHQQLRFVHSSGFPTGFSPLQYINVKNVPITTFI